jgi:hypothetical protein
MKIRAIQAAKARKAGLPAPPLIKRPSYKKIKPGDVFDHLTAVESRPGVKGYAMWLFQCRCHSAAFVTRVATVRYNLRKIGWASCRDCYHAAGAWKAIAALGLTVPTEILERLGAVKARVPVKAPTPEVIVEPTTVDRIVAFVRDRPSWVKITTLNEIEKGLSLPRKFVLLGVRRAVERGLLMKKHRRNANGYVFVRQQTALTNGNCEPSTDAGGAPYFDVENG